MMYPKMVGTPWSNNNQILIRMPEELLLLVTHKE